jgi:hypothetical protein
MDEKYFDYESIYQNLNNDDFVLSSVYDIDNVLSLMKEANDKEQFYKELKKFRNDQISCEIEKHATRALKLKNLIARTMAQLEPSKKTLDFPGVAKVTRKKDSLSWEVEDEDAVIRYFASKNMKQDIVETEEKLSKKKLNEALAKVDPTKVTGLKSKETKNPISITWHTDEKETNNEVQVSQNNTISQPVPQPTVKKSIALNEV